MKRMIHAGKTATPLVALGAALSILSGCAQTGTPQTIERADGAEMEVVRPNRDSSDLFGAYLAASQARVSHDFEQASDLFRDVLKVKPGTVPVLSKAFLNAIESGQRDEAERLAASLLDQSDSAYVSRLVLALKAVRTKQFGDLIGPGVKPKFAEKMLFEPMVKGWAYAGAGEPEKAVEEFETLSEAGQLTSFHDYYAALIYDFCGETQKAEKAFDRLRDAGEGSIRVIVAHGRFLERQGKHDEAIALYDRFLEQNGDNLAILEERARAQRKGSVPAFITSASHGLSEAFYAFGAEMAARDSGTSVLFLRMALFAYEDHKPARLLLARLFEVNERLDTALFEYRKIGGSGAHALSAKTRAAEIESELNEGSDDVPLRELRSLANSTDIHAARRMILESIGRILGNEERWADAIEVYTDMIEETGPEVRDDWRLYFARAVAYERSKQWDAAEADLMHALELEPDQPEVLNYLGYSWIDRGINLTEGRIMIERAVEARPDAGFIVDSLGWVHYRLGNYEQAVTALERAVALEPGDPTINDHLGDALWRVGRRIEARFQWRHALGMDPTPELEAAIRSKLEWGLGAPEPLPSSSATREGAKAHS